MINKSFNRSDQAGLSLVELLISMTIGLVLLLSVSIAYTTSKKGTGFIGNTAKISEDASFALNIIARDVRMAGYAGCTGSNVLISPGPPPVEKLTPDIAALKSVTLSGTAKPNPFAGVIAGNLQDVFTAKNAIWGFAANDTAAMGALGGSATTYTIGKSSPMLYVAGGSSNALQVQSEVAAVKDNIKIQADTYKWANNTNSTIFIISDCRGSELFRADAVKASGLSYEISHAATVNATDSLKNTYSSDAIVTPLVSAVYFIATRNGALTPSLYRRSFNGSVAVSEELVANIEAIAFEYGVNTKDTTVAPIGPTYRADEYKADPATVADWSRVVSVRIGLIAVSEEDGKSDAAAAQISWLGGVYTPPNDRRLRRAYGTTVSIRNRMGL